ncbi:hypothetical protein KOW79_005851 [Hemibagrus wyckioides]|uniref:SPRY-associated domain-containing protein n=1 Tax=Hemibagrus wyckioides TaxID=337641 RepID=A0A9D3SPP0_9TELE|nr:hypothetical protein KOW79_005851 [Hemibagrus wyckioides]
MGRDFTPEFCEEELNKIRPDADCSVSPSEPQSREDFLKYFCYLTLDPDTAHHNLILSEKNRVPGNNLRRGRKQPNEKVKVSGFILQPFTQEEDLNETLRTRADKEGRCKQWTLYITI